MTKATKEVQQPMDADYIFLFLDEEEEVSAIPTSPTPTSPATLAATTGPPPTSLPPPVTPIDVIQVSSDTESGADGNEDEGEVDWVTTQGESIADRVSTKACQLGYIWGCLMM